MKAIIFWVLVCFSLNSFAEDYFSELRRPNDPYALLQSKEKGFAAWSKAAFDYGRDKLTQAEYAALKDYTGPGYFEINGYLRKDNSASSYSKDKVYNIRYKIEKMNSGLKKLPSYTGYAFRGGNMNQALVDKLKVGDVLLDPAFSSASFFPETAKRFAFNAPPVEGQSKTLFAIKVEHSAYALPLLSKFENEAEVLIPSGMPLEVLSVERVGQVNYVALRSIKALDGLNGSVYNSFTGDVLQVITTTKPIEVEEVGGWRGGVCKAV
jgi:hypothetical protein